MQSARLLSYKFEQGLPAAASTLGDYHPANHLATLINKAGSIKRLVFRAACRFTYCSRVGSRAPCTENE